MAVRLSVDVVALEHVAVAASLINTEPVSHSPTSTALVKTYTLGRTHAVTRGRDRARVAMTNYHAVQVIPIPHRVLAVRVVLVLDITAVTLPRHVV
jgi:hypothetical protein